MSKILQLLEESYKSWNDRYLTIANTERIVGGGWSSVADWGKDKHFALSKSIEAQNAITKYKTMEELIKRMAELGDKDAIALIED